MPAGRTGRLLTVMQFAGFAVEAAEENGLAGSGQVIGESESRLKGVVVVGDQTNRNTVLSGKHHAIQIVLGGEARRSFDTHAGSVDRVVRVPDGRALNVIAGDEVRQGV